MKLVHGDFAFLSWSEGGIQYDIDLSQLYYNHQFEEERVVTFNNIKSGSVIYDISGNIFTAKTLAARNCTVISKCKNEEIFETF
jgi:tRNA G37 N-methylase Trm5